METNPYFTKEIRVGKRNFRVLQLANMSPLAELRYKKLLKARMFYTEFGEIVIRFKLANNKIVFRILQSIDDAIRQQNHIINKQKETKLSPRTSNTEHRKEVLTAEKTIMDNIVTTAIRITEKTLKEAKEDKPDFGKIKNLINWLDLGIAGLWVKPYLTTAININKFTPDASLAASYKEVNNLSVNLNIILSHLTELKTNLS